MSHADGSCVLMQVKNTRKLTPLKMPQKTNELVEKWLKYKDTDKTNKINVKQDIGLGREIAGSHEA